MKQWTTQRDARNQRIAAGSRFANSKTVDTSRLVEFLSVVVQPGDRVCLEGNNQKGSVAVRWLSRTKAIR